MANPVLIKVVTPGCNSNGWSRQARKSRPAEPSVAYCGNGKTSPNLGSKILYSIKDLSKTLININNSKSKLQIYSGNKKLKYLYKYNVSSYKAKVNLGWTSRIPINKGLKLIIDKKYEYICFNMCEIGFKRCKK